MFAHGSPISLFAPPHPKPVREIKNNNLQRHVQIEGFWEGSLKENDKSVRLVLKISRAPDGDLRARLDSPDDGFMDIPVDTIRFKDSSLHFEIGMFHASYDGTFAQDGSAIVGRHKSGGATSDVLFKRTIRPATVSTYYPVLHPIGSFRTRLSQLQQELVAGNRRTLESFWRDVTKEGTPLIEPVQGDNKHLLITFLWRGNAKTRNVVVMSDLDQAGRDEPSDNQMSHLPNSDLWYRSYLAENDLRLTYEFSPNDPLTPWSKRNSEEHFTLDPLNRQNQDGTGSPVQLPGAEPQPWIKPQAGIPMGKLERKMLESKFLNDKRDVLIYTPPGYALTGKPYGLLLLFDAPMYVILIPTATILDNLIAQDQIPPLVMINVSSSDKARNREFGCNQHFEDFLSKELIPWVRAQYHVSSDPSETVIGGASLGGFAAAYAGLQHPEIFGNVLSQGAPFWFNQGCQGGREWLTKEFAARKHLPLRFFLEVGALETDVDEVSGLTQIASNERLRDVLRTKGYTAVYEQSRGGHNIFNWRSGFAHGLLALLGKHSA